MVERPSRLLGEAIERNVLDVGVGAAEEVDHVRCRRVRRLSGARARARAGELGELATGAGAPTK